MIRFIIIATCVILYLILSLIVVPFVLLIGVFNREKRDCIFLRMVQAMFQLFLKIAGTKITVIGEENIPSDTAVLFVGNHRSAFDILVTYSRMTRLTGYVAKDSLLKVPLLSMWMKFLYCLFLNRENVREGLKTILKGVEYMKAGISICIFPEGTRGKEEGKLLDFKEGSLKMAQKTGCPIVPMALSNTAGIWENQFPKIRPAHVILEYGKPIYVNQLEGDDKKFPGAYTQRVIQEMLDKNTPNI